MRKTIFVSMFVILVTLLVACGSTADPVTPVSAAQVAVIVESNPSPAVTGDVELVFTITDADGNPLEGAKVEVDVTPENGGYRALIRNPGRIQNSASANGVGLANSKARLDLLYGEKHGLKIEHSSAGVQTSFWFSGENRT